MRYNLRMATTRPDQNDLSRRDVLRLGALGGGALAFTRLPPSLRNVITQPPPPGGLDQIEHVILLMQENRSFDHYFGTLSGVRGYGDRTVLRTRGGGTMFEQPQSDGTTVLPFAVREAAARQQQEFQYIGDLPHGWEDGQGAWARGWNDAWVPNKTSATMAGYDRADIPLHFELADAFTICDAYHCSVKSATSPNRNYFVSGYAGFEPGTTTRAVTNAAYDELEHAGYDWPTYAELLEAAGVSWKVYQEWDNFGDNNLEFFASFKAVMRAALAPIEGGKHKTASGFYGSLFARPGPEQDMMLAALDDAVLALPPDQRGLFDKGIRRTPLGSLADELATDIAAGTLPAVSYLVPSAADSEHPGASSPIQSARLMYNVLDALASHPDVWARTALFITYDENDGLYDHVAPPAPPPETADEFEGDMPIGLGVRVPMIVVSPWTVGGWVSSEVFDHSSITQFLERWTGVATDQITDWRRTVAGDLTGVFDFANSSTPPPPAEQQLPAQEPGTRPARALPYQPDVAVEIDGTTLRLTLSNAGARPAHMVVYDWTGDTEPAPFDVVDEQLVEVATSGGAYDLTVTGPNRFVRDFVGTVTSAIALSTDIPATDQALDVAMRNDSSDEVMFTMTPLQYLDGATDIPVGAGAQSVWSVPMEDSSGDRKSVV